jgi:hypothetical protein
MGTVLTWEGPIGGERADADEALAKQVRGVVLDAVTSPGKVRVLPPAELPPPAHWPSTVVQVAQTLLSSHARFAVLGQGAASFTRHLVQCTGAQPAPLHKADYVIAGDPLDWLDVWSISAADRASRHGSTLLLSSGILVQTEAGEQASIGIDRCTDTANDTDELTSVIPLHTRAVYGRRALIACDPATRLLQRLAARQAERSAHIDVMLADRSGRIVALPHGTWWLRGGTIWAA